MLLTRTTAIALAMLALAAGPAQSKGIIERACLDSDRSTASSKLCNCIQAVADQVLAPSEQRRGATLFADPHQSQVIRQSDDAADNAFWRKWKTYGATAAKHCG